MWFTRSIYLVFFLVFSVKLVGCTPTVANERWLKASKQVNSVNCYF